MVTATFVKDMSKNFTGTAKLWKLSEPVDCEGGNEKIDHVVTSATIVMFSGAETYIFPADESGNVVSWLEMDGSYRGGLDHEQAIENAGWIIGQ